MNASSPSSPPSNPDGKRERLRIAVRGAVQGVGFRPFIFRLASRFGLAGWVNNSPQGVFIEVEGENETLQQFLVRLEIEKPVHSFIQSLEPVWLDPAGYSEFEIRESDEAGPRNAFVLPDIATCPDCLREIFDPANRRFRYPFTNCTHCGPRFSIIERLPYDRANTSMKAFVMCAQCQAEYDDPHNRRFHAQPNACPVCGPRVAFRNAGARSALALGHEALAAAVNAIRGGQVVAIQGIGGFHLFADAGSEGAVGRLRERKHREEKPFAVLAPTLECAQSLCSVSPLEARLLLSPEAPIVLLRKLQRLHGPGAFDIATNVAPGNPNLGVMLPSNPLHHLLMAELKRPVVATSGNLSDEPICISEPEAFERLGVIADDFLTHDRPIVRHVDDSIVRVMLDRELVLRRARGYAPLPVSFAAAAKSGSVLAVGAHLKNTIALSVGPQIFISQHIGDLETNEAYEAFRRVSSDFLMLYEARPAIVAADLHPDYLSTKYAGEMTQGSAAGERSSGSRSQGSSPRRVGVQHHVAHVLSCLAENAVALPALGVAWDGTGYGTDRTIWGGEFFDLEAHQCRRIARLRPFRLPGGDKAVREPRRAALGLLFEMVGESALDQARWPFLSGLQASECATIRSLLKRGIHAPYTSSAGRLFDAVAALIGLRGQTRYEGQTAMELEFALEGVVTDAAYPVVCDSTAGAEGPASLDWAPMIRAVLTDVEAGVPIGLISAKFHNGLAELIVAMARQSGRQRVLLSGGCFQNRYLVEQSVRRLRLAGFHPYWHQRVPPNDGGIALGQVVGAVLGW